MGIFHSAADSNRVCGSFLYYLFDFRSPIRGKFKIPNLPAIKNREDIYSQIPNDDHDENEYKFVSFSYFTRFSFNLHYLYRKFNLAGYILC